MDYCRYLILVGCLYLGLASVSSLEMECNGIEEPNKYILCYANSSISLLTHVDVCRCSHLVVPLAVNTLSDGNLTLDEEFVGFLKASGSRNGGRLHRVLSLTVSSEDFSAISSVQSIATSVAGMIDELLIEGVEIYWQRPTIDENSKKDKANLVLFMKELHAVLQEKIIVTSSPHPNSDMNRTSAGDISEIDATRPLILLRLPTAPEFLVKAFDLKPLARTVDLFVIATHEMVDASNVTYHHSRLMGLSDILNTDSVLDLVASLGVSSDRVVTAVPTFAVQFRLRDVHQNLPGSPVVGDPLRISKDKLCSMLSKGNWTVERDDDLTGTYAYSDEGDWIAFDDEIAAQIKAKYFLLRDVAGVAMMPANMDDKLTHGCNAHIAQPSIVQIYYEQFQYQKSGERTRRQLATSLQEDVSSAATTLSSPMYNERVRASPYRIVRIVSRSGETSVIRQPLESSLQCSRQGYYRHPEDCGRFYRCVKFDQYIDDFTVFEYDCPEGLVFDERYEVCTWPSQAAPCGGSSEIRPVPMNKFVCPGEGYFADPENCRWFFACRDYAKDGSPFTQYEFRCPFGLLFDEQNLICNWPWLVPQCSGASTSGSIASTSNIDVIKFKAQGENKQPSAVAIGSPGYLSGKLVTGEGLYTDPRPAQYRETVVSTGCIDCQSAGLVVRDPSQDTNPASPKAKDSKLVLAIPAATIADQSTPVRIIVASPALSNQQYTSSTTPQSYVQKSLSTTTVPYESSNGLGSYGLSDFRESPVIQQAHESSSSSEFPAPSVISLPNSSGSLGNGQLSGYPHGQTPIITTKNIVLQRPSGKDESDVYRVETTSKDDPTLSSYSDPSGKYATLVGVSSPPGLQTQHETLGYNGGNVKDGSNHQGKHGVGLLAPDGSPLYPSGLGSASTQGTHDRYSDVLGVGYGGSVKTEAKTSSWDPKTTVGYPQKLLGGLVVSNQATAYETPTGNSRYSEYQESAVVYQAPTTEASFMSYTTLQSQYQDPAFDQKRLYSAQQMPVSNEKVSESFSEAPAAVTKLLVGAYKDPVYYNGAPNPTYPPVYEAATPVYRAHSIYQSPAPAYEASAPVYEAPVPAYKVPTPVYQAPAIVHKNPAASYKAPVPVYQTSTSVYQIPSIAYKNSPAAYEVPDDVYKNPAPAYEAPAPAYAAPAPAYEASTPVYRASTTIYQDPASAYKAPAPIYQPPTPVYEAPAAVYKASTSTYDTPKSDFQTPTSDFQAPTSVYEASTSVYQAPTSVGRAPANTYEPPAAVYKASTSAQQAPAPFYELTAPAFQAPTFANEAATSVYEASVPDDEASIRIHESGAGTEQISPPVYTASTTIPPSQAYETADPSHKPLIPGHKTMVPTHQASFPIYKESPDNPKSSKTVDKVSSRVYEGPPAVYKAPLAGIEISNARIHGENAAANKATPSSYEKPIPNYGTDTRSASDVPAPTYKNPNPVGSSNPYTYGSFNTRPFGSSAYDSQKTDAKSENVYPSTLTTPYVPGGETADRRTFSYTAKSPSKTEGSGDDRKLSSSSVPADVYGETTSEQNGSGGESGAETEKTNDVTSIRTTSSHTYNAESANEQQINRDYQIREGKNVVRVSTSPYSSGVAPSVQYKSTEKGQVPKEMGSNIADHFHRGSTSESTTKAPRGRLNSSLSSVMHGVKQPMKGNLEISRVSGSRRIEDAGEMRGTFGADGASRVGGVGGARRTGGGNESRRTGVGSRTQGTGGSRKVGGGRDKTHGAAVATGATGYTATDYSVAGDGLNSEAYGKSSQNTYSPFSRNQDDYEISDQFVDNTFGLKEDVKTKNKYNAAQPAVGISGVANENTKAYTNANRRTSNGKISYGGSRVDNGNGDSGNKKKEILIGHAEYKGSESERVRTEQDQAQWTFGMDSRTHQSSSDATILPPALSYRDKLDDQPKNYEANTSYGDKRITVKVPSTNKAAILEKWAFTTPSVTDTKPDFLEAKRPAGVAGSSLNATPAKSLSSTKRVTLNNRHQIKNRINARPKNQALNPDMAQSNVEISANDAKTSSSWKKTTNNGLGVLVGSEYGNRYLEKITIAQATARNETLGSEVCVRAGLFRHPYDCQKFYECYWDRWIHQYTVHIFKCPVHLVYDDYITACNWPLDGPACVPHEAVKLYPQLPSAA